MRWDHPRMRGENDRYDLMLQLPEGSPPHARGKFYLIASDFPTTGITPACAGKIGRPASPTTTPRDHPRMRGENTL